MTRLQNYHPLTTQGVRELFRRAREDALRLLARVRLPGGMLSGAQLRALPLRLAAARSRRGCGGHSD